MKYVTIAQLLDKKGQVIAQKMGWQHQTLTKAKNQLEIFRSQSMIAFKFDDNYDRSKFRQVDNSLKTSFSIFYGNYEFLKVKIIKSIIDDENKNSAKYKIGDFDYNKFIEQFKLKKPKKKTDEEVIRKIPLRYVKKGEAFKLEDGNSYITLRKGEYDKSQKKFCCQYVYNNSMNKMLDGSTIVNVGYKNFRYL